MNPENINGNNVRNMRTTNWEDRKERKDVLTIKQ